MIWSLLKRSLIFEDAAGDLQELAHAGDKSRFFLFSPVEQTLIVDTNRGVVTSRYESCEVQSSANSPVSLLADAWFLANRCSRFPLDHIQAGERLPLFNRVVESIRTIPLCANNGETLLPG